jgi:WD40 repeat protein
VLLLNVNENGRRELRFVKGIISAIAFSTDYSGLYAAGSYSGSVGLYDEDSERSVGFLEGIHQGGVTQVRFSSPHFRLSRTYLNQLKRCFIARIQPTITQYARRSIAQSYEYTSL